MHISPFRITPAIFMVASACSTQPAQASAAIAQGSNVPSAGLTMKVALEAARAAVRKCVGLPVAVAIIDSAGAAKLIYVPDGSPGTYGDFARGKANTALRYGEPSAAVRDKIKLDALLAKEISADPTLLPFGGGFPLYRGSQSLGALAVAGAPTQDEDELCGKAALAVARSAMSSQSRMR